MYKIIKTSDGTCLGMTEAPTYIKQAENGCYILCPEPEASGISFKGTVYHLLDRDNLDGAESVMLKDADVGVEFAAANTAIEDADAMNVDHEYRITLLELGINDETA